MYFCKFSVLRSRHFYERKRASSRSAHILRRRVRVVRPRRERVAGEQVREAVGRHVGRGGVGRASDEDARESAQKVPDPVRRPFGLDSTREDEDDRSP